MDYHSLHFTAIFFLFFCYTRLHGFMDRRIDKRKKGREGKEERDALTNAHILLMGQPLSLFYIKEGAGGIII